MRVAFPDPGFGVYPDFSRRRFLLAACGGLAGASAGAQSNSLPAAGRTAAATKLGLDLFSLRSQRWSATQHLDYCAKLGLEVAHFSEPRFLGSLETKHLEEVKAHADRLNLSLEVGRGSICPTSGRFDRSQGTAEEQLLRMFGVAGKLGSPIVRCFLGTMADRRSSIPLETHMEATVKACRAVRGRALEMGVSIAIENHAGDPQARELKWIIEEAGPDFVGAFLDSGNAPWALEDPLLTLETLVPYVLSSSVRDTAVWEVPNGAAVQWVVMGEGNVGIRRFAARFIELCPGKPFSLEIIVARGPRVMNYLQSEFWDAYRKTPAWEFTRFLSLAKRGSPYQGIPPGPAGASPRSREFRNFLVEQERKDVERSVKYSQEVLGIGKAGTAAAAVAGDNRKSEQRPLA